LEVTVQVVANTILDFALDELVLHRKVILNVTRAFLDVMTDIQIPPTQVVLDIPDDIVISVKHAIVLLGRNEIRRWVSQLLPRGPDDEPVAMREIAMLRAKHCELPASRAKPALEGYFTVGMFSALDLLMQQSPCSIVGKLPLSDPVKDAIIRHNGAMGGALSCVLAVENAQWSATGFEKLYQDDILDAYKEAVRWTDRLITGL
jgi:EAL and modified HD-GYP domain-containing signal transduction protein